MVSYFLDKYFNNEPQTFWFLIFYNEQRKNDQVLRITPQQIFAI